MSDESVAKLLRSNEPFVLIEASAGCGKTFQGATYARDVANSIGTGRLLILTHTHAACAVFAERTKGAGARVEIKTIDALIAQIATAYHKPLGLPRNLSSWAWQDNGRGFDIMATKVATFLRLQPMVAKTLAHRYPIIICDEHQDSSVDQHSVVMALRGGGAMLRIFGDPLQRIYGAKTDKAARIDRERWEALKREAVYGKLDAPHRWKDGCLALGEWILAARACLESGQQIDLTGSLPASFAHTHGQQYGADAHGLSTVESSSATDRQSCPQTPDENRQLKVRLPQLLAWLAARATRCRLPAGNQARRPVFPEAGNRGRRLSRRILRTEDLQRRCPAGRECADRYRLWQPAVPGPQKRLLAAT
jgi:hypothetical protein